MRPIVAKQCQTLSSSVKQYLSSNVKQCIHLQEACDKVDARGGALFVS